MSFTFILFFALIGAAFLAFICAWYLQQGKIEKAVRETDDIKKKLGEKGANIELLEKEIKAQKLTIENLQKQSQAAENELIQLHAEMRILDGVVKISESENEALSNENALLEEELKKNIREIVVIHESPPEESIEGPSEENGQSDARIEKAKRLVFAFKKGVSGNTNAPPKVG